MFFQFELRSLVAVDKSCDVKGLLFGEIGIVQRRLRV